jgi:hypothetical protein
LGSLGSLGNGSFVLTFSGANGHSYEVLATTNLALPVSNWTILTSGGFGTGPVTYTNTSATNAQQFYRIESQ